MPSRPRTQLAATHCPIATNPTFPQARYTHLHRQSLNPAGPDHPCHGVRFSAGWGSREELHTVLVDPNLVAEFSADVALDAAGL